MKIWNTETFWSRVDEKLDKKGLNLNTMIVECGLKASTVYTGRSQERIPRSKGAVMRMANFLGTTPEYLMTGENDHNGNSPEEDRLLLLFGQLSKEKQEAVINLIISML